MIRVGINGFGRIGRSFLRLASMDPDIEVVAINDLGSLENFAYLLKYDSVYGRAPFSVEMSNGGLRVGEKDIVFLSEKDPTQLPWQRLGIDVVVESTGFFTDYEKAQAHITAGAKRVVISAPSHSDSPLGATVLMGVNEEKLSTCKITSNGSCTTNASSPLIAILDAAIGIDKALLTTTHAYTSTQAIVDGPTKGHDLRKGRAAAQNIIPTSTGAAVAVTKAYEPLQGNFDGIALRVPVPAGSVTDITFIAKKPTSVAEVNAALKQACSDARWNGIFTVTEEQLVSSDIIGQPYASIADLSMTRVVGGTLVKVLAWYDNESGYTHALLRHVKTAGNHLS